MDSGQAILALSFWGDLAELGNIEGFIDIDGNGLLDDPIPHPIWGPHPPRVPGYRAFDVADKEDQSGPEFLILLTENARTVSFGFTDETPRNIIRNPFVDLRRVLGRGNLLSTTMVDVVINDARDGYFALSERGRIISVVSDPEGPSGRAFVASAAVRAPFLTSPITAVDLEVLPGGGDPESFKGYILTSDGEIEPVIPRGADPAEVPVLIPITPLRFKGTFVDMELVISSDDELLGAVLANGVGEFYVAKPEGGEAPPVDLGEAGFDSLHFPLSTPLVLQAFDVVPTDDTFGIIALERTGALHAFGKTSRFLPTLGPTGELRHVDLNWGTAARDISVNVYPGRGGAR